MALKTPPIHATPRVASDSRLIGTLGSYPRGGQRYEPGVWLWDAETGGELHRFVASELRLLAISPDGQTLATAGSYGTVVLWDISKVRPAAVSVEVTDALWTDLAADATRAYQAVVAPGRAGDRGVALLKEKLPPAKPIEAKRLVQLFTDLDDDRFAVRQKAAAELARLDVSADALRDRLATTNSAEARKALTQLLEKRESFLTERLRELRAVAQRHASGPTLAGRSGKRGPRGPADP